MQKQWTEWVWSPYFRVCKQQNSKTIEIIFFKCSFANGDCKTCITCISQQWLIDIYRSIVCMECFPLHFVSLPKEKSNNRKKLQNNLFVLYFIDRTHDLWPNDFGLSNNTHRVCIESIRIRIVNVKKVEKNKE